MFLLLKKQDLDENICWELGFNTQPMVNFIKLFLEETPQDLIRFTNCFRDRTNEVNDWRDRR